jgi:hypothetical protein
LTTITSAPVQLGATVASADPGQVNAPVVVVVVATPLTVIAAVRAFVSLRAPLA